MDLVPFLVALLVLVVVAAGVMVFVAYPHRGRAPRHGRWAASALGRVAGPVQVHDAADPRALLASPTQDETMRERMRRVERVVTAGISGRRGS